MPIMYTTRIIKLNNLFLPTLHALSIEIINLRQTGFNKNHSVMLLNTISSHKRKGFFKNDVHKLNAIRICMTSLYTYM